MLYSVLRYDGTALDFLRHEVNVREARDGKKAAVYGQPTAATNPRVEESDDGLKEGEILDTKLASKSASKSARENGRRPARVSARQPTNKATKKRKHDEYSDGEADDEGDEDRKKVRITVI